MRIYRSARWSFWALSALVSLPLLASAPASNQLSGRVRDVDGNSLEGANVWVVGRTSTGVKLQSLKTDEEGRFLLESLPSGIYAVRVSKRMFESQVKEDLHLNSGQERWLDLKLKPVAASLASRQDARVIAAEDWRWVLRARAAALRSVLRLLPEEAGPGSPVHGNKGSAVILAGNSGDGDDMGSNTSARFSYDSEQGYGASLTVRGSTAAAERATGATLSTRWRIQGLSNSPELSFTAGYQILPENPSYQTARSFRGGTSQSVTLPGDLNLEYELAFVRVELDSETTVLLPTVTLHRNVGRDADLFYAYRSESPDDLILPGPESVAPAGNSGPRLPLFTFRDGRLVPQTIRHHEAGIRRRIGEDQELAASAYQATVQDLALPVMGHGFQEGLMSSLYMPISDRGGAYVNGGNVDARGIKVTYAGSLPHHLRAVVSCAYGDSLAPAGTTLDQASPVTFEERRTYSVGARITTRIPVAQTTLRVGYRWSPTPFLLPGGVATTAETDLPAFLAVRLRQPIPPVLFLPEGLTLLAEAENLLNQGGYSFSLSDGTELELFPVFRSFRGGLAYNF